MAGDYVFLLLPCFPWMGRPACATRRWPPLGRSALRADSPAVLAKPACTAELTTLLRSSVQTATV